MYDRFLHTARIFVSDTDNFLKTDTEICLDFKTRLNKQKNTIDDTRANPSASYNRIVAVTGQMEVQCPEEDMLVFLEENY